MPLINKGFSLSKMNKDFDDRILPKEEYRDALNIQVSSSDSSDVGTAQTLLGNVLMSAGLVPEGSSCVGSIADNKNDKVYYFVSGPKFVQEDSFKEGIWKDYIIQYDIKTDIFKYVFVDIYRTHALVKNSLGRTVNLVPNAGIVKAGSFRKEMVVNGYAQGSNTHIVVTDNSQVVEITGWGTDTIDIYSDNVDYNSTPVPSNTLLQCTSKRLLNFEANRYITGINIIDDMLFWTDNFSEPKKINIKRCIAGTGGAAELPSGGIGVFQGNNQDFHTRLCITPDKGNSLRVKRRDDTYAWFNQEENITVIKKGPRTPPRLVMSQHEDGRNGNTHSPTDGTAAHISGIPAANANSLVIAGVAGGQTRVKVPGEEIRNVKVENPVDWRVGDMILLNQQQEINSSEGFVEHDVRATVLPNTAANSTAASIGPWDLLIQAIDTEAIDEEQKIWNLRLEERKPMFEFKFVRFAYRYKYEDGEYSVYSPWSEPAFLPGEYDFLPKKGFNLGMTNRLRQLKITNYIVEDSERPQDVIQVDLLYKDESSPNIYTVESIKLTDGWSTKGEKLWPDILNNLAPTITTSDRARGEYEVTSELIHAVVPSNQLLRPYDNVPRRALAQEITSNRLVYGNYVQNFDLVGQFSNTEIKPLINVVLKAVDAPLNAPEGTLNTPLNGEDNAEGFVLPGKTVRSLRTYQLGVVYGDEFGRETPVIAGAGGSGSITIDVANSSTFNQLRVDIGTEPPSFANYYKYYIKETSNEYYNLAMDRWYDAEDGNIWLSFASADRNKVDIENFIVLKKKHDKHEPVVDPARYKIIAIENSAPDFIKTNIKILSMVKNNAGKNHIGTSSLGFPLKDYDQMWVDDQATGADNLFNVSPTELNDKVNDGTLYMRVRTSTIKSNWYQVSNFKAAGNKYKFKSDKAFGEDVNFTSTNNNWQSKVSDLRVEIANFKVENKKEFEGRFFVKIFKDLVLIENLLTASEPKYKVINAKEIGYFNIPVADYNKVQYGGGILNWEHCGLIMQGDLVAFSSPNAYSGGGGNLGYSPGGGTPCCGESGNASGGMRGINKDQFFKPAKNGWQWESDNTCASVENTKRFVQNSEGRFHIDAMWVRGVKAANGKKCQDDRSSFTKDAKTGPTRGRGVSPDGKQMDIGYIARGSGGSDGWKNDGDQEFIQSMLSYGTTFRFREDPDSIIYVTTGSKGTAPFSGSYDDSEYGWHHTYSKKSADGYGNNKYRWRIDFERSGRPDEGLGSGASGYHPIGPKPATNSPSIPELGYWGGVHRYPSWDLGSTNLLGNSMQVPAPPGTVDGGGNQVYQVKAGTTSYSNAITGETYSGELQAKKWRIHASKFHHIEIVEPIEDEDSDWSSLNPAVWETEPKEDVGMDIYYEASPALPVRIDYKTNESFAPYGSIVVGDYGPAFPADTGILSWSGDKVFLTNDVDIPGSGFRVAFIRPDGFRTHAIVQNFGPVTYPHTVSSFRVRSVPIAPNASNNAYSDAPANQPSTLSWYNAIAFGNGIESDRIRDDFNQNTIANGVKASTVLAKQYSEERRKAGLIHSGIYNSTSGVNSLNQFIAAEKITKDMNPKYGSIQKLHTRDSNIVVMHEDKIMKVLADKDALFNADQSKNVVVSANFLGSDSPFATKYGISTNPESFATDLSGRVYFSDRSRGAILRLSGSGIDNISNFGMKDWFNDHLTPYTNKILGSFDQRKGLYNITIDGFTEDDIADNGDGSSNNGVDASGQCGCLDENSERIGYAGEDAIPFQASNITSFNKTLSFSESSKGWVSFKSFLPESGVSINNNYYTFKNGDIYRHHANNTRNFFYGEQFDSSVNIVFNDDPAAVKSFTTINYEGSKSRITSNSSDKEYYNLDVKEGWYVNSIITDLQSCDDLEFKNKEGKYFTSVKGNTTTLNNLDESEFSVQGIGAATVVVAGEALAEEALEMCLTITPVADCGDIYGCTNNLSPNYNPSATVDDGSCAVVGCMDPSANNFNALATYDDGSCSYLAGCTDPSADNYDSLATVDDGTCIYAGPCSEQMYLISMTSSNPTQALPCYASGDVTYPLVCAGDGFIEWVVSGPVAVSYFTSSMFSTPGGYGVAVSPPTIGLNQSVVYNPGNNTTTYTWTNLGSDNSPYHLYLTNSNGCTLNAGNVAGCNASVCEPDMQVALELAIPVPPPTVSCTDTSGNEGIEVANVLTSTSFINGGNDYIFPGYAGSALDLMAGPGIDCFRTTTSEAAIIMSSPDWGLQFDSTATQPYNWVMNSYDVANPAHQRLQKWVIGIPVNRDYPNDIIEAFANHHNYASNALTKADGSTSYNTSSIVVSPGQVNPSTESFVSGLTTGGIWGEELIWADVIAILNELQADAGNPIFGNNPTALGPNFDPGSDSIVDVLNVMGENPFLFPVVACCDGVNATEFNDTKSCNCAS